MFSRLTPPDWLVHEMQHRLVLLLNHVVMQEPEAQGRLTRQQGRTLLAQWRQFELRLQITPAGLLDLAPATARPDLTITVEQESPWRIAQTAMQGDKPAVRIEGDVQLAAEVNWLADHLRWDVEEDLARLIGDVPAHALVGTARRIGQALKGFVDKIAPAAGRQPQGGAHGNQPESPQA